MLPPLVTVAAFGELMQTSFVPGSAEDKRAESVLNIASTQVRAAAGKTWVDTSGVLLDVPEVAAALTLQLAVRIWANPSGDESQTAGPFSRRPGAGLLSEDEVAALVNATRSTGGLGVLQTTRGDDLNDAPSQMVPNGSGGWVYF